MDVGVKGWPLRKSGSQEAVTWKGREEKVFENGYAEPQQAHLTSNLKCYWKLEERLRPEGTICIDISGRMMMADASGWVAMDTNISKETWGNLGVYKGM